MLYEIDQPPAAAESVILLHSNDNVAVARVSLPSGHEVVVAGNAVRCLTPIPAGHKVALRAIAEGEPVLRYGNVIGFAKTAIAAGEHVHTHNLGYKELDASEVIPADAPVRSNAHVDQRTFRGYRRKDGRVGTRNYIAVVAASNCAAYTSELIAQSFQQQEMPPNVDGVVAFPHAEGCAMGAGPDLDQLRRTLNGVLNHPNVSGALLVGLGCETNHTSYYTGVNTMTLQDSGGTLGTVEAARKRLLQLIEAAREEQRVETPASFLNVGLNCGGSDSFSGITANPALGYACDLIVDQGGTIVLAETTEIFGAEHLLVRRARSADIARKLLDQIANYKRYLRQFGGSFNDNPSHGNKEGGLTNILEKSLGAVAKAGTTTLEDVVDYAERVNGPGFVFMNTPGYDPVSITGLAAGGVNLIAFTTGRGSAIGFPSIPVLKIATNSSTYRRMPGNMDINAGTIAEGSATVQEVGREIFEALLRIASGERTKAEKLGHHEFAPWRIGPVL